MVNKALFLGGGTLGGGRFIMAPSNSPPFWYPTESLEVRWCCHWPFGAHGPGPMRREQNKTGHKTCWVVVSNHFYFHPYLGKIPIFTNKFQMG